MSDTFVAPAQSKSLALTLMLAASSLVAVTTLFAKALGTDVLGPALHPVQVTHGRFLFAFLVLSSVAAVVRPSVRRPHWGLHVARSTAGFAGVTLMFAAVARIPMADATAITFLNPVFAMMLAIPLLGENVGRVRWSAAAIALLGAVILLRPGPGTFQPAALLAVGSAAVMGLEVIFIKKLAGRERPFQVLLINNMIGLGIATCAVLPVWQMPTAGQWAAMGGLGAAMALAQTCYINAVARAEASFVAPFAYATLVFATIYDSAIFGVLPDWISFLGAGTILGGAALLAWRETRRAQ
ncbi:EamA-like transporter family protein [Aliiruegeria haliotis]|uniref:EamA-like transporter family protein n=1 Tax=Aliiruegeria haliotis TaxID=1280846 RepID=A0A2T0RWE2_9RHOB|nr:DMT family transporter [Aliiruegeria haliotis]PRY25478.1 EamA-like transporter family protein [Aliiruegeria haliotis]